MSEIIAPSPQGELALWRVAMMGAFVARRVGVGSLWLASAMLLGCGGNAEPGGVDAAGVDSGADTGSGAADSGRDTGGATCTTDADGDGALAARCGGGDCDDANPDVSPSANEVCDVAALDEDCDPTTFGMRDGDGDGYFDAACCNGTTCGDDCDDAVGNTHPTANESCDRVDNDCDATIDEAVTATVYVDADGDGYGTGAAMQQCADTAGYSPTAGDCDDAVAVANPAAPEVCDGIDNDCDGTVDDGVQLRWYQDADGDGYGNATITIDACSTPTGYVADATDCDDACAGCHSGATEVCDAHDNDCNGMTDENPGAPCTAGIGACAADGFLTCSGTCGATLGTPSSAYHRTAAPNGSWDWNCNGSIEAQYPIGSTQTSLAGYCATFSSTTCPASSTADVWGPTVGAAGGAPYCGQSLWYPFTRPACMVSGLSCVPRGSQTTYMQGCH